MGLTWNIVWVYFMWLKILGEVSEWLKETVSKTVVLDFWHPGFESLPLRSKKIRLSIWP